MNSSAELTGLVPTGVVTVMSETPDPDGEVASISVPEMTMKLAVSEAKLTCVASVNPVPTMVTEVPPALRPAPGLTAVTAGAAS